MLNRIGRVCSNSSSLQRRPSRLVLAMAAAAGLSGGLAASNSALATISFISSNGDITTGSNWAGGIVPGINDIAEINNAGIGTLSSGESFTAQEIDLGNPGGVGYGVLQQTGGTVNIGAWLVVGRFNPGEYDFSGGTLNKTGGGMFLVVGNASQSGIMNMSGNATMTAVNSGNFAVGDTDFNNGQSNGQLSLQDQASINTGGAQLWIGEGGGANGRLIMSGGSITTSSWVSLGRTGGTGEFDLSGGSFTKTGDNTTHFIIGDSGGGSGTLNQTGGLITSSTSDVYVGSSTTGTYNISGGSLVSAALVFGPSGGNGTLNLNGGSISATVVQVGSGSGTLNLNGGVLQALASNSSFLQGFSTTNVTVQSGGAIFDTGGFNNTITIGLKGTGGLTLQGSGGSISLAASNSYAGDTTVNGGILAIGSASSLGAGVNVNLNGGQLQIGADSVVAGKTLNFNGGVLGFLNYNSSAISFNNTANLNLGAATGIPSSLSGLISGSQSLTYSGPGTLNLTNPANTYTGGTFITAGVLEAVPGSLGTGTVTVSNTGLLGIGSDSSLPGNVVFNGGGISFNNYTSALNFNPGINLTLGAATGAASKLTGVISDGPSSGTSVTYVGPGILALTGSNTYTGGTNIASGTLNVTSGSLGNGPVLLSGGTVQFATGYTADLTAAPYNLTISSSGGTVDTAGNNVAFAGNILNSGTPGVFNKTGLGTLSLAGSLSPSSFFVRQGTLALTGASSITTTGYVSAGLLPGDNGTLAVSGTSALTVLGDLNVGDNGSNTSTGSIGVMTIQDSAVVSARTFYVGKSIDAMGTVNQTGGTLQEANNGALPGNWQIGGTGSTADVAAIGIYNLSGGIFNDGPANFQVGVYGVGTVAQTGGAATIGGFLSIGRYAGGKGLYDMSSGNGIITATGQGQSVVGEGGTGVLKVGGASVFTTKALYIEQDDGSTGTVQQTGGIINAPAGVVFGSSASGNASSPINAIYNLSGGILITSGFSQNAATNVTGTLNFNGGTLQANQSTSTLIGSISHAYVQTGGAIFNSSGYNITNPHALQHDPSAGAPAIDGGLTQTGAGSLTLSGSNTYTGPTRVQSGALIINADAALPSGNHVIVSPAATLILPDQASASSAGSVDIGGYLIVHNGAIATLTASASQGFAGGRWNGPGGIVSSLAAADSTHLTAVGTIQNSVDGTPTGAALYSTLGGQSIVDTDVLAKYTYFGDSNLDGKVDGTDYSRIDNGFLTHATGWFNGDFNYDGVINGSDYTLIDNAFNTQGAQFTAVLANATAQIAGAGSAVPEPATLGLLGFSALGLLGRRGRK